MKKSLLYSSAILGACLVFLYATFPSFAPSLDSLTSQHEEALIEPLLSQKFTFLGEGGQCYAFLGEDKKTVLKFFKKDPSLTFMLNSAQIAHDKLKKETGLIAIHLSTSTKQLPKVTLVDRWGVPHRKDVNNLCFVLQEKAEPFFMNSKANIDKLFAYLLSWKNKGVWNTDSAIYRNLGILNGEIICFDIGSFVPDDPAITPEEFRKELRRKTMRLRRWMKKQAPELLPYCEEKMSAF